MLRIFSLSAAPSPVEPFYGIQGGWAMQTGAAAATRPSRAPGSPAARSAREVGESITHVR